MLMRNHDFQRRFVCVCVCALLIATGWDFEELKRANKERRDYPQMPVFDGDASALGEAVPVIIDVGDLLVFRQTHYRRTPKVI